MAVRRTISAVTCLVCMTLLACVAAAESEAPMYRDDDLQRYREKNQGTDTRWQRDAAFDFPTEKDRETIFRENDRSVCAVAAYNAEGKGFSHGSCFFVNRDGVVVTSFHVLSNAASARMKTAEHIYAMEGVLFADREYDVIVLKTDGRGVPGLKLGDSRDIRAGDRIFLMDSVQGTGNRVMEGKVRGLRDVGGRRMIQLSLQLLPGSSGGPIFNSHGEVIGIAAMIVSDGIPISFAVPIEAVKDHLTGSVLTLQEALKRDRRQAADYWIAAGDAHSVAGRDHEALNAYHEALDADPDSSKAYNGIGVIYNRMKQFDEAVDAFEQALKRDPDSAWTRSNLGLAYIELKRYPEAVDTLRKAVRSMPDLSVAHFNLGIAYAKSEQYRQAAASYRDAIKLNPSMADAYYGLGLAYLALHDRKEALRQHEILNQLDPSLAQDLWERIRE